MLIELTPARHRCYGVSSTCPAVFKSEKRTYVIVGKVIDVSSHEELRGRIGDNEAAVEIPADLIEAIIARKLSKQS